MRVLNIQIDILFANCKNEVQVLRKMHNTNYGYSDQYNIY